MLFYRVLSPRGITGESVNWTLTPETHLVKRERESEKLSLLLEKREREEKGKVRKKRGLGELFELPQ